MGRLVEAVKSLFDKRTTAPGKCVIIQTKAGDIDRTTELYHPPGISSAPTKGDRVIEIPLGAGVRVAVATHNYKIEVEPLSGETIIYSTDSDGNTVKAQIKLDGSGNIDLNGNNKKLVTHAELNTALQSLVAAINANFATKQDAAGAPGTLSIDISAAETQTVRTGG